VKTAIAVGLLGAWCGAAVGQTEDSRLTPRDNAVVKAVLQDLVAYRGKDSPLDGPFGPSRPLQVMVGPLRGRPSLAAADRCGLEERPWRTLTKVQQQATEQAARHLERRAPQASGRWSLVVRDVEMIEEGHRPGLIEEGHRPRNELGLQRGVDVSLPGYSADGSVAIVLVTMPWSIHSATGTYVLLRDDTGWRVVLREFAYSA
jgi:hypothetical protein